MYSVAVRTRFVTNLEALFLAVVAVAFPANKMLGGFLDSEPPLCTCLFLLAALLMLCAEQRSGIAHWLLRLLALFLFGCSFFTESHRLFFGAFLLLLVLIQQRDQGLPWYRLPWSYCFRRLDLLLLPVASWIIERSLAGPGPSTVSSTRPGLDFQSIVAGYSSLPAVLFDPFLLFASLRVWQKMALVWSTLLTARLVTAFVRYYSRTQESEPTPGTNWSRSFALLLFGLVLLILATFPYVAVGRTFAPWGEQTRDNALLPLPVAILLLAVGTVLPRRLGQPLRPGFSGLAVVVCGCLAVWTLAWWNNYMMLQAVQIRNTAVLREVDANPEARACSVYGIRDEFPIPRASDDLTTWRWSYAESGVSGEPRSIAFLASPGARPLSEQEVKDFLRVSTMPYALTTINPAGKQGLVTFRPRPRFRTTTSVFVYLYLKYFEPERLGRFLDNVAEVEFVPWNSRAVASATPARRP